MVSHQCPESFDMVEYQVGSDDFFLLSVRCTWHFYMFAIMFYALLFLHWCETPIMSDLLYLTGLHILDVCTLFSLLTQTRILFSSPVCSSLTFGELSL